MQSFSILTPNKCPYWDRQIKECRLCKNGLFIPLDDHIGMYCTTEFHNQCMQFGMLIDNTISTITINNHTANRRKHPRVEANIHITLVKHHSGEIGSHFSNLATTVDLSVGGMRLATNQPLKNNSVVRFSFNDTIENDHKDCTGRVAWCYKTIDQPGYQAGIIFKDRDIKKALSIFLDSKHPSA